jgi:hypothetical protein
MPAKGNNNELRGINNVKNAFEKELSMSFIDELDLSVAHPVPAGQLSLVKSEKSMYVTDEKAWEIKAAGGYLSFGVALSTVHGINFILRFRGSGQQDASLSVRVNGEVVVENVTPQAGAFKNVSWYIIAQNLIQGDNTITVTMQDGTSGVFIDRVITSEYDMEMQQQQAWCWATVTVCTSHFYDSDSPWKQCSLVNDALGQSSCCNDGSTPECDVPWYLDKALEITGNLESYSSGSESIDSLLAQLDENRPVGARVAFGTAGHFVMITGVSPDREMIMIEDSYFGSSYIMYEKFKSHYKGIGVWSHSYFTKPKQGV